jgi:hypothetical protein
VAASARRLVLGASALLEHASEPVVAALALERGLGAALPDLGEAALHALELGSGDAGATALDLADELLGTLSRGGLERQRPEPLPYLVLEISRALHLDLDAGKLQLRAVATLLEAAEAGGFLDERAPVGGLRAEDLLDPALADHRVELCAEADLGEELDDVEPAHPGTVDEVLTFSAAMQAARDGELREVDGAGAVLVVEEKLDLGELPRVTARPAREENVVRLFGTELARAQAAGSPDDRVGDVRFSRPVRADDDRHPGLEANLDWIRERLEAAQAYGAQVHAARV